MAQASDPQIIPKLQQNIDSYVADRGKIEGISGISLYVDRGGHQPPIALYSGNNGRQDTKPIDGATLFQIGSNTKHFTAALILKLEAMGKLNIHQTIAHWLPRYTAWHDVTIESLLNMTSILPNYSEAPEIAEQMSADIHRQFSFEDLIAAVDPRNGKTFPPNPPWFYSNTNNIVAALIIQTASGMSYREALNTFILKPLRLKDTFYFDGAASRRVLDREPRAVYKNEDCTIYQPKPCTSSAWAPLIGKDMRTQNLSWGGPAGGMVSTPHDLAKWIRALFGLHFIPQPQLGEMKKIVSEKTGMPIADVGPDDLGGFGLDLGRVYQATFGGAIWFYQGTTFGSRAIFAYWPEYDLVITAATNSQPPDGEDQFAPGVVGNTFKILQDAGLLGSPRH